MIVTCARGFLSAAIFPRLTPLRRELEKTLRRLAGVLIYSTLDSEYSVFLPSLLPSPRHAAGSGGRSEWSRTTNRGTCCSLELGKRRFPIFLSRAIDNELSR